MGRASGFETEEERLLAAILDGWEREDHAQMVRDREFDDFLGYSKITVEDMERFVNKNRKRHSFEEAMRLAIQAFEKALEKRK